MGYFDDLLEDEPVAAKPKRRGYFDDLLEEEDAIPASQPKPTKLAPWDTFQPKPKVEEESVFRQALDIPVNIARGGVQGIKMMTDILGADNPVSKSLSGVEGYMADLLSAQAKEDQAEISRIMQDAEDKGFGEQVKAGIKAFSIAPVDTLSQALGTMAPVLATGLAGSAAKLGSLGIRAVQTGVGAGMGAGMTKGNIYSEVKDELVKAGIGEQEAEKAAVDAQSYGGKNLDQILLGAGLGAASTIGAESIITRMLTKQGTAPTAGMVSRVLKGGITEAIPETAQAAQEQLATNIALQREGLDVPTMRGVVSAGTMEGIAGAAMGGVVGGLERPSPLKEKTLTEENFEATNDIARNVAENGAPLTASALQDKSSSILRQDELARQLDEQLEAVKPTVAPPTAIPTKDDYVARYSAIAQVAPEELTRAEQSFTSELATADTEEKRTNAQNALDAIKEVKATIAPPAPPVEPTITPAVTPAVTTAQPPITDATQEILQPEGVRQEPQDGTQVETEETGVSRGLQPPARGEEEGQVIFGLRSVADNTATREQISALSEAGLVDIVKGKPVINEDGAAILAQPAAPAIVEQEPVTTPALEEAVTPAPIAEAPVVSEEGGQVSEITTAPTIGEEPQVSPEIENLIQRAESAATREEAAQIGSDFAELDPSIPPPPSAEYEIVKAISDKANRRPYNADVLTEENITAAKEAGLVTKTKVPKLTESGRSLVTDGARVARDREMAIGDITDRIIDQTVSAWDAKNNPNSFSFKARIAAQPTPAPVTEPAAEAPAPEVVPIQRDVTKPEQMTPEERGIQGHKLVIEQARQDFELAKTGQTFGFSGGQTYKSKAAAIKDTKNTLERVSKPTEADIKRGASDHYGEINRAVADSKPVSTDAVEVYGVALPEGYTKQGDLYVYQPTPAVSETITDQAAAPAQPTEFGFVKDIDSTRENIKKNLIRFASGMSGLSDMRRGSYARAGHRNYGIGFDVGLLSKNTINELANFIVNLDTQVFIDSGAFSSFKKAIKEGRTVEALDFDRILAKYDSIIDEIDKANAVEKTDYPRPMLVMPDVIGNQKASLDLIDKHKNWIATAISFDTSTPIIPIPLGELSLSDAYSSIIDILKTNTLGLEIDPNKFVVGIPSNAEAISRDKLAEFLKQSKPPRIHFLGAAADKNISPLIDAVAQNSPNTQVTADASKVRSAILNGVSKGKTRQQAIFDALYQEDDPSVTLDSIGKNPEQLTPTEPAAQPTTTTQPTGIAVGNRVKLGKSPQTYTIEEEIPQTANDMKFGEQYYSVKNERTGETQVVEKNDMKPVSSRRRKMASEPDPLPENERYGQVKLNQRIQRYFGGKIPDRVYVVDDAVDKEKKYQAAYYPDLGILIVNNAYIKKNANVGDIIAHELGHYAFGDKKFKAAFDNFYNSLSPEDKAKIDKIVEESYNEETEESQIEESKVIAFTSYTIVNPQRRSLWNAVLDALKEFANKVFGKNFQMSDPNRTALAILSTAKKRFAAGEEIVREDIQARKMSAQTQDARFAELEARAKAGDKEAEAEAQRMVDEAAKEAGYDSENLLFHGTTHIFNVFKKDRANIQNDLGKGYYFTNTGNDAQVNYAGEGPDLTNRIERLAEQLESNEEIPREEAISKAKEILSGNEQRIINAYLKLDNPFIIGRPNETFLDYNENFDPETEEYGEPSGKLLEFIENFREVAFKYDGATPEEGVQKLMEAAIGYDGLGASEIIKILKEDGSGIMYAEDSNGDLASSEIIREAIEATGFDGIVDTLVNQKFGSQKRIGKAMAGMEQGTVHTVAFNSNQIKSSAPFTYDDAGALIPLSERFQSSEPDIRRMAVEAEPRTEQVAGRTDRGTPIITTPVGIIKQTNEVLRKNFFDGTTVSDEATKNAWLYISRLLDIKSGEANNLAGQINDLVDVETNSDSRMGASLFSVSLANYSAKLAALGDSTMLSFLVRRINRMPVDNRAGGRKEAGEALRAAREYDIDGYGALKVEQKAKRDRTAAEIFARGNPTKEQVKAVSDAIDAADNATIGTPEEVASDVEKVEKRTKRNITKKLETLLKKGSLKEMIASIKNTPLEEQQAPGWIEKVIKGYLEQAGLTGDAATTAAKLYDSILSERFVEAKQKAFEETLGRSAPWNNYLSRNSRMAKDSLKKIQVAIRTGVLDPSKTIESVIAKENGWDGFTKEQFERIVQLDNIINNPDNDDVTRREAMSDLNKIIVDAKLPVRFKDALGAYYVGNALMGIPTVTVNIASPIGFTVRNMMTDIGKYAFTDPARIPIAFESFLDSMRSWYDQTSYAFKNQIYLNDVVEYLQGQNVLRELFDKGKKQWANGEYAAGFVNMAVGMTQITGRVLSSLDQGAIAMLENQNITRYAMEALAANTKGKIPKDKLKEFANMVLHTKRRVIAESIASGMPRDRAGVLADLAVKSEVISALSSEGISPMDTLDASINDALLSVGRNKAITIKGVENETTNLSDEGMLSYLPISFLQTIASGAARQGSGMQIFSKMLYGFALVPARVFHNVAWFSPYGFVRLWVDSMKKKRGQDSPYAMSLQTEAQFKQRLTEAIAGSIVMLGLAALRAGSSDDEDDRQFRIVITGNGPSATTDRQYYDSWNKKWKPYSIHIVVGDTIIPINIGRGGEALFFPIMLAGAMDDWEIKKKQNATKKEPEDLSAMASMLGSSFFALAQRGPYAAFTKPLFDASKDGRVTEELASQAGYFGKTFIPFLGTSVARNITDFINDPVDRSSVEGAIYANTPIVGPWMGAKALNALGQPVRADDWGDKLFKLGVPVVFSFPKNTPMNELNELILKQGSGPSIPTRTNAQKRFGDILTDDEFESYVREYGKVMSDRMFKNRSKLARMKPSNYDDELEKYARGYSAGDFKVKGASDMAVQAVKRMRQ